MQSVSSRIWSRVAVSISYDDNHYTTSTSIAAWKKLRFILSVRSDFHMTDSLSIAKPIIVDVFSTLVRRSTSLLNMMTSSRKLKLKISVFKNFFFWLKLLLGNNYGLVDLIRNIKEFKKPWNSQDVVPASTENQCSSSTRCYRTQ